ncbi:hypothetical protein CXU21_05405 [Akkermansia muciniphila]|nr:hypothetical protein CXU21_05405 [Akkermansia muciniphila]
MRISYPPHVRKLRKCPQDTEKGECSPALQGAFNHEGREVFIPGWMFPAGLPFLWSLDGCWGWE